MKHANAQEIAERSRLRTRDEGRDMDWEDYHDLDTIYAWLDELEGKEGNVEMGYRVGQSCFRSENNIFFNTARRALCEISRAVYGPYTPVKKQRKEKR